MDCIIKADDAMFFMKHLLKSIGCPSNCSHVQFVETFAALQKEAEQYRTEMRLAYEDSLKLPSKNGVNIEEVV